MRLGLRVKLAALASSPASFRLTASQAVFPQGLHFVLQRFETALDRQLQASWGRGDGPSNPNLLLKSRLVGGLSGRVQRLAGRLLVKPSTLS